MSASKAVEKQINSDKVSIEKTSSTQVRRLTDNSVDTAIQKEGQKVMNQNIQFAPILKCFRMRTKKLTEVLSIRSKYFRF